MPSKVFTQLVQSLKPAAVAGSYEKQKKSLLEQCLAQYGWGINGQKSSRTGSSHQTRYAEKRIQLCTGQQC